MGVSVAVMRQAAQLSFFSARVATPGLAEGKPGRAAGVLLLRRQNRKRCRRFIPEPSIS
jgi:hypothetical protein